ncbi:MAG: hypothetical protein JWO22_3466 [Frankiales bacterium]|nr:hypothetical protein [Frankiales bacterium]
MIVATWNLAAQASAAHEEYLESLGADVLLVTEVPASAATGARSNGTMTLGQHYADVRGAEPADSALDFTARGSRDGVTYLSSVLPWRGMGGSQAERTLEWVERLDAAWPDGPVVWGGDWNHEMHGRVWVGCREGRDAINGLLERRGLVCRTAMLQTRQGARSIDHIALPATWSVRQVEIREAVGLSDHDGVIVECEPA